MDIRDVSILMLISTTILLGFLVLKQTTRVGYLEGQKDIYDWQTEAEDHVCGPYEQPVHKSFQKKGQVYKR